MPFGMYISAEGAQAQSRRLEVIANNMANVNTVGFKPDVTTFQARLTESILQGGALHGDRSNDDVGGGVAVIDTKPDFAAGRLQETGNTLDLAIIGNGFFEVADGNENRFLTRAGNFSVDSQNRLVTQNGMRVLDAGGGEITVNPDQPLSITPTGELHQEDTLLPLSLVSPESLDTLDKVGLNLFRSRSTTSPVLAGEREVRSGFLEMSGANPTRQTMNMIETSRAFEANIRLIQNHDSMSGSLIGRVLRA